MAKRERPILFSGPMVRAILEGRKTQTRRVVKPQPRIARYGPSHPTHPNGVIGRLPGAWGGGDYHVWAARSDYDVPLMAGSEWAIERYCPYGQPGDRLWVKETFWQAARSAADQTGEYKHYWGSTVEYAEQRDKAGWHNGDQYGKGWMVKRPSIHMARKFSRLTLEVVAVRVERLQAISDADAVAEGVDTRCDGECGATPCSMAVPAYHRLWDEINGAGSWDADPWVWVVEFRRLTNGEA